MRRFGNRAAVFCGFVLVALIATNPLIFSATSMLAGGLGDPLLGTVLLAWDADRIRHLFNGLWDPPYLYPLHHTLAYTEHLLGIAVFIAPIEWITRNPVLAYNAAFIGSYVLAGLGMFVLARDLWRRVDAAILAGVAFAVTPYRLAQTTHLQVLMNGWMPVALWALHRYFASGARRWLIGFTAAYIALGLSNGYYLYFFLLPIVVLVGGELVRPRLPRRRLLADLTMAAAGVAVAIAPVAWTYYSLQRRGGFTRAFEYLPGLSAHLSDYFRVGYGAWTWGGLLQPGGQERELFHGLVPITFAVVGACTLARPGAAHPVQGSWRRAVGAYLLIAILAVWLSMGPGPGRPYALLFYIIPGLSGLRVPARLAAVVSVAIAVLAAAGFARVLEGRSRRTALITTLVFCVVMMLEGQHGVYLSDARPPGSRTWERVAYDWLRDSPPGAVLELNITRMNDFHPFTTMYQLNALRHRHPIINGYAGFPSVLQEYLGDRGSPVHEPGNMAEVLRGLRAIGVRYVMLHEATFDRREDAARLVAEVQASRDQATEAHRFGETWAWRLADAAPMMPPGGNVPGQQRIDPRSFHLDASHRQERIALAVDGDIDTRWLSGVPQGGNEWIEVHLSAPTDVARVTISTAPRSILDYPRHLTIESVAASGHTETLFDGGVVDRMIEGLAADQLRAPIDLDLGSNETTTLRFRQTGHGSAWWSVHELTLWERR